MQNRIERHKQGNALISAGTVRWMVVFIVVLLGGSSWGWSQEPESGQPQEAQGEDAADLVRRIQESMEKIDENLLGASAAGARENLEESIRNLEKLLEDTRDRSSQVVRDLDTLIRSIKYRQCSSGGGGKPPPQPDSSEQPENQPRSEQEDEELQKNKQSQDEADKEEEPDDSRPREGQGQQNARENPEGPPPEQVDHADLSGRWGVLPPKIQQDILNFNIEAFPEKYRKWLESYYKKINRRNDR